MAQRSVTWRLKMRGMLALVSTVPTPWYHLHSAVCTVLCLVYTVLSTLLCAVCIRLPLSPVYDPDEKFSNYLMLLELKSKTKAFFLNNYVSVILEKY